MRAIVTQSVCRGPQNAPRKMTRDSTAWGSLPDPFQCQWCGTMANRPWSAKDARRYCGRVCGFEAKGHIRREISALKRLGRRVKLGCPGCGSRARQGFCNGCSKERARAYGRRRWAERSPNRGNPERQCAHCGEPFTATPGSWRRAYCSPQCTRREARRRRRNRERAA